LTDDPRGEAVKRLSAGGIENARLDARLLWEHAEKTSLAERGNAADVFDRLVDRRLAREPLAYIVGHKEFWSLEFAVGPGVLVPRPETEILIEELCKSFPDRGARLSILDLGTGSGCLLVAALREYANAHGVGVEASSEALGWAKRNIAAHRLEDRANLIESGWLDEASPGFDVLLCNPPYVASGDIAALEPEVRLFEPRSALDGGVDGLDAYRLLAPRIGRLLSSGGRAYLEIGAGQSEPVGQILRTNHLRIVSLAVDLAGIPRCFVLKRDVEAE